MSDLKDVSSNREEYENTDTQQKAFSNDHNQQDHTQQDHEDNDELFDPEDGQKLWENNRQGKNNKAFFNLKIFVLLLIPCLVLLFLSKRLFFAKEKIPDESEEAPLSLKFDYPGNKSQITKTYVAPFLDTQFENPTPYDEIKTPIIEEDDYIPKLKMTCYLYNKDHLNIIIRDAEKMRYELPHEAPFPFPKDVNSVLPEESDFTINVEFEPFNFIIKRKSTKEVIFNLVDRFVFTNLYMEVSFVMPTNEIYGLGERISPLQFKDGTYSLFIIDRIGKDDKGKPGFNGQGHQSMYLCKEKSNLYHVMLFKNIAAQEVIVQDRNITWKAIGGVYDFHFFLGEHPEDAVKKYHFYIGGWTLPALWHMGYHQSKWWGYGDVNHFRSVMENFEKAGIPFDVLWSDLDIYKDNQNFNYNERKFPPKETQNLFKQYNKRWIPVLQAYIPTQMDNPCWRYPANITEYMVVDGMRKEPLVGYEFSGYTRFIDYLHPEVPKFWSHMIDYVNSKLPAAGLWLDANEVSNGLSIHGRDIYFKNINKRNYYKLPFYPGGVNLYTLRLINLDALHYGGIEEFNVRSLNAFYQSQMSYNYLKDRGVYFPFVLSRGNMFGMGQYSFHWIPDVDQTWELMRISLGSTMTYQIFGFPMVGADICGFLGDKRTETQLCIRWHQLAAFYPFARNSHSPIHKFDNYQEPYVFNSIALKDSILFRYSLLKQFYAYFFMQPMYTQELRVGTIMRPLFFEFYGDKTRPEYGSRVYEEQFMMSDAIMAAPVLYPNSITVSAYFPDCKWYDLRNGREIPARNKYLTIDAKIEDGVPHFLRGGKLIFKQNVDGIRSTEDLNNIFNITAGLDDFVTSENRKKAQAVGTILDVPNYSEEVIYKQCVEGNCLMNVTLDCSYGESEFKVTVSSKSHNGAVRTEGHVQINFITLLGVSGDFFNQGASGKAKLEDGGAYEWTFDKNDHVLSIHLLDKIYLDNNSNLVFTFKV